MLQQCANGGTREDLGAVARFDESYTNEAPTRPSLQAFSGKTLALPPEILMIGIATTEEVGHIDTFLRAHFTVSTPQVVTPPAPTLNDLSPDVKERGLHSIRLYKSFIRPLLPTCKVFHHAPVSLTHGSTSAAWFAMEFMAPNCEKGWVTIVRLGAGDRGSDGDVYDYVPRGLDRSMTYKVSSTTRA